MLNHSTCKYCSNFNPRKPFLPRHTYNCLNLSHDLPSRLLSCTPTCFKPSVKFTTTLLNKPQQLKLQGVK